MKSLTLLNVVLIIGFADNISGRTPLLPIGPDCSTVKCAQVLTCPEGQYSVKQADECCAKCVPDCRATLCLQPTCTIDQVLVKPEDQCCERCELNCAAVSCVACRPGQTVISSPDRCCPKCGPDCSTVKCAQVLKCPKGQISVKPDDACCAKCVPYTEPGCLCDSGDHL